MERFLFKKIKNTLVYAQLKVEKHANSRIHAAKGSEDPTILG